MGMSEVNVEIRLKPLRRTFFKYSCAHLIACLIVLLVPTKSFENDLYGLVAITVALGPIYYFFHIYEEIKEVISGEPK